MANDGERTTVWVTGDQCSPRNTALAGLDRATTTVLLVESIGRSNEVRYHKRKLALIFATMRGYADDLRAGGWTVDYRAEQPEYETPLADHVARFSPSRIVTMEQTQYGLDARLERAARAHGLGFETTPHCNFVSTRAEFDDLFVGDKHRVTMETFYRRMRHKTGLLMDGDEPAGGTWNFDHDNRKPPRAGMAFPPEPAVPLRAHARDACAMVERVFPDHPGTTAGFDLPTTRADALAYADDFFATRLDGFGPYEDAMVRGEPRLYHSRLSALINVGLLHPYELCERAELAYRNGDARLASVEGFVRQLIGWREFIWQTYWRFMPEYRTRNGLGAELPVPAFYRDGQTDMACVAEAMRWTLELGWAHHILRLMVLGNFALLAGIEPQATTDWFWEMFVDGYDWVMVPNVVGMTLHADGGVVGTKPYAASGNYINKMSDYCRGCSYDVKAAVGEDACPFNSMYWDFIARNAKRFAHNTRMSLPLRNWAAKDEPQQRAIRERAKALRDRIAAGERF